jgi:hypothetical protein
VAIVIWEPPEGMRPDVAKAWRAFYANAASGKDGYSITPWQYRMLYIAQKGRCWVCRVAMGIHPDDPDGNGTRRLGVDHNHVTGAVRGLLCTGSLEPRTCNRLIEWYTPEALARAAEYKRRPPARVLIELETARRQAAAAGETPMTDADQEALAVAFLWRDKP